MRKTVLTEEALSRIVSDAKQKVEMVDCNGNNYRITLTISTPRTSRHFMAHEYISNRLVIMRYSEISKVVVDDVEIIFSTN